jgi:hypothetical protein
MSDRIIVRHKFPSGTIYFTQAHSLRWLGIGQTRPNLLRLELLSNALLFKHLVVQDSHLVQNYDLFSFLSAGPNGPLDLATLIKEGILVIGKRIDQSIIDTANDQISRGVPTLWDNREQPLPKEALEYAKALDVSMKHGLYIEWSVEEMKRHFMQTCEKEVLNDERMLESLNLPQQVAEPLLEEIRRLYKENLLTAQRVYDLSGWKGEIPKQPSFFHQYSESIKRFATWVHNMHFPVLFEMPVSFSTRVADRQATELYLEKHVLRMPPVKVEPREDILRQLEKTAEPLVFGGANTAISRRGIVPVLRLRNTKEFDKLQQARDAYQHACESLAKEPDKESFFGQEKYCRNCLDEAMSAYAEKLWTVYERDLEGEEPIREEVSALVSYMLSETGRKLSNAHVKQRGSQLGLASLALLTTVLISLGAPVHIASLGLIPIATGAHSLFRERGLLRSQAILGNAQRLCANICAEPQAKEFDDEH